MTKPELIETLQKMSVSEEEIAACKTNPELEALIEKKNSEKTEEKKPFDYNAYMNEKIPFRAIKDDGKYKDDIVVTVNGKNYTIQRGITVSIPRFLYQALEDADRQKAHATDVSAGFENQYKQHVKNNML